MYRAPAGSARGRGSDHAGSAEHIAVIQEEQIPWMCERNGIFFGDDEPPTYESGEDEPGEDDERPTFKAWEVEPDDIVVFARAWLR